MQNQQFETEFYTYLGNKLLEAISKIKVDDWEKVVLHIYMTDSDSIEFKSRYFLNGEEKGFFLVSPKPYSEIINFKKYTEDNNFRPWNHLAFELSSDHKFNLSFNWVEELDN
jgi:hypothetical protein